MTTDKRRWMTRDEECKKKLGSEASIGITGSSAWWTVDCGLSTRRLRGGDLRVIKWSPRNNRAPPLVYVFLSIWPPSSSTYIYIQIPQMWRRVGICTSAQPIVAIMVDLGWSCAAKGSWSYGPSTARSISVHFEFIQSLMAAQRTQLYVTAIRPSMAFCLTFRTPQTVT